jgi:hypothetical protein
MVLPVPFFSITPAHPQEKMGTGTATGLHPANSALKNNLTPGHNTPPVLPVPFFSSLTVEPSLCSIFVMRLYVY